MMNYLLLPLRTIVILFTSNKEIKKYKINKRTNPINVSKIKIPPELKVEYSDIDIERFRNTELEDKIKRFVSVITENFPREYLDNFYKNINSIKFINKDLEKRNLVFGTNTAGFYRAFNNSISIDNALTNCDEVIFHELFHMASARNTEDCVYSGFSQAYFDNSFNDFAYGLNEGYTELLAYRYFGDPNKPRKSPYAYEMLVSSRIEKLIGKENMEKFYLTNDFKGLADSLKVYTSEEEVMTFITRLDLINKYFRKRKVTDYERDRIEESIEMVNDFLVKSYIGKTKEFVRSGEITSRDDLIKNIVTYTSKMIPSEIVSRHGNYYYAYLEDLNIEIDKIYNKEELKMIDREPEVTVRGR